MVESSVSGRGNAAGSALLILLLALITVGMIIVGTCMGSSMGTVVEAEAQKHGLLLLSVIGIA